MFEAETNMSHLACDNRTHNNVDVIRGQLISASNGTQVISGHMQILNDSIMTSIFDVGFGRIVL